MQSASAILIFSWKSEVFVALWGHNLKQSKLKMQDTEVDVCGMTTLIGGSKIKKWKKTEIYFCLKKAFLSITIQLIFLLIQTFCS